MDNPVIIVQDTNKQRLKELKQKVRGNQKLTPQEQEEAIERILKHLGLD